MRLKKALALTLATTMALGSSVMAFADDETVINAGMDTPASIGSQGVGGLEGWAETDVFSVVLPTVANDAFDFKLDPQGLVDSTSNAAYAESEDSSAKTATKVVFDESVKTKGLFFKTSSVTANVENYEYTTGTSTDTVAVTTNTYSPSSSTVTVINKSSIDVSITVEAGITEDEKILLVNNETFTENDASSSMYMKLVSGDEAAFITKGTAAKLTSEIGKAPAGAYEYKYYPATEGADAKPAEYKYELVNDLSNITFNTYSFNLAGGCNMNGDWSEAKDEAPKLDVKWQVTVVPETPEVPADVAPSISTTEYTMVANTAIEVQANLGAGNLQATGVSSIEYVNSSGAIRVLAEDNYTVVDNKITFTADYIDGVLAAGVTSREYTIKFANSASTETVIRLKK